MKQHLQSWSKRVIFSVFMELPSVGFIKYPLFNFHQKLKEEFVLYCTFGGNAQISL